MGGAQMRWIKSECIDPRCDWSHSLGGTALYRKQKGHLQMTQTARKGKLYQLQYLIDLSCFIISHILVFGRPNSSIQQNSYTSLTPPTKRTAPPELTDLPSKLSLAKRLPHASAGERPQRGIGKGPGLSPTHTRTIWADYHKQQNSEAIDFGVLAKLSGSGQFFSHHSPKNYLNWFLLARNVLAQSIIDQCLIIPTTSRVHFTAKPFQN